MKRLQKVNVALQNGMANEIFVHVRNYLICAFILAIGVNEFKQQENLLFGFIENEYSGVGVIGIAIILMAVNLYDGIRKLSVLKFHVIFNIVLVAVYVLLTLRVMEMTLTYRSLPFF